MRPDAPTPAREKGLQPYGALYCFKGRTEGFQRASGKPFGAPAGAIPCPGGLDAPTPARIGTCRPMGRSHFSFGGERKVCKRKPAARRLREKALYCPFLKEGVRIVARSGVGQLTPTVVRARSSPFSAVKMGGPFSLRCLSPLCSPAVGVGQAYPLRVEIMPVAWRSCSAKYEGFCFRRSRRRAGSLITGNERPAGLGARAARPVAERRSESAAKQGAMPDRRAVAPVVPRR